MRRQGLAVLAAALSLTALLTPAPVRANATTTCTERQDNFCELYCPGDPVRDCNLTFRFTGCETADANCVIDGLCPDDNSSGCCNMYTGVGCSGSEPFCAVVHVYCNFF